MTETTIAAIVTAFFTALTPTVVAYLAYKTTKETKAAVQANDLKTDAITKKTDQIHEVTNAHLTKVTNELTLANQKITDLQTLVATIAGKNTPVAVAPAKE